MIRRKWFYFSFLLVFSTGVFGEEAHFKEETALVNQRASVTQLQRIDFLWNKLQSPDYYPFREEGTKLFVELVVPLLKSEEKTDLDLAITRLSALKTDDVLDELSKLKEATDSSKELKQTIDQILLNNERMESLYVVLDATINMKNPPIMREKTKDEIRFLFSVGNTKYKLTTRNGRVSKMESNHSSSKSWYETTLPLIQMGLLTRPFISEFSFSHSEGVVDMGRHLRGLPPLRLPPPPPYRTMEEWDADRVERENRRYAAREALMFLMRDAGVGGYIVTERTGRIIFTE